jgi:hypothetical protein
MTKEELEKEAEEYSQKTCSYIRVELVQAFLAGAEPREKRIEELEEQIEKMKSDVMANIKWADRNCDKMWQKLVKMWNQWEINEK